MWSFPVLAVGVGAAVTAASPPAAPTERRLSDVVTVSAGATCLESSSIVSHVRAWLRRETVPATVRVSVRGDPMFSNRAVYSIARAGRIRERRFDQLPSNCAEAQAVMGLAVALALDDTLLERVGGDAVPSIPLHFEIEAGAGISAPYGLSFGGSFGLDATLSTLFSARADALYQYSFGNRVEDTNGTFDAMVFGGALRLCSGGSVGGDIRLSLCVGPGGGALRSAGHGFTVSRVGVGPWVVMMSGVRLGFTAGLRWNLDVDVVAPLFVPPIAVEKNGTEQSRDPSPTGLLVGFGPSFDL